MNYISVSKDGNLYYLNHVKVQRGMGNQKANEVLIYGFNINEHPEQYKKLLKDIFTSDIVKQLLSMEEYRVEWGEEE